MISLSGIFATVKKLSLELISNLTTIGILPYNDLTPLRNIRSPTLIVHVTTVTDFIDDP